jgi:hypothetical protein
MANVETWVIEAVLQDNPSAQLVESTAQVAPGTNAFINAHSIGGVHIDWVTANFAVSSPISWPFVIAIVMHVVLTPVAAQSFVTVP